MGGGGYPFEENSVKIFFLTLPYLPRKYNFQGTEVIEGVLNGVAVGVLIESHFNVQLKSRLSGTNNNLRKSEA